jgi:DUF4097 and DUF4098 domain-containing protein YvlB
VIPRGLPRGVSLQNVEIKHSEDGACGYAIRGRYRGGILHGIKDSTLSVTEKVFHMHRVLRLFEFLRDADKASIVISVPKDSSLDAVSVKNISGKTAIQGIQCQALEIRTASGKTSVAASHAAVFKARQTSGRLTVDGCTMENADVGTSSGNVEMKDTRPRGLKISSSSGNTTLSGIPTGNTEIQSTSGGITLDIADKKQNYDVDIDVSGGKIYIDGQKQTGRKRSSARRNGNGGNGLRLKTTGGDVKVNFHGGTRAVHIRSGLSSRFACMERNPSSP